MTKPTTHILSKFVIVFYIEAAHNHCLFVYMNSWMNNPDRRWAYFMIIHEKKRVNLNERARTLICRQRERERKR